MTDEQKSWIQEAWQLIQEEPGGINYRVYTSISIIRIQNTKINKQYRMIAIEHHITKDRILEMMLKAFREMETEINAGGVKR